MSSTASQISDFNLLRRCGKRSSKKNNSTIAELYNNLYASQMVAADQRAKMSPQRTISLGSLHHPPPTQFMEPRLSQLETLEAKMASIEVSLSTTLKKTKKSSTPIIPSSPQPPTIAQKTITPVKINGYMTDNHDKENIARNNVKLQTHLVNETNEQNKYNQKVQSDTVNESEKHSLTQKIESLKNDMDQKRLTIKNIKMSLEQLDVTDNIDTRIQQAELEYQLGREELNLLSLMEETNKHKCRLEEIEQHNEQNENNTLYNYLVSNPGAVISLQAVELEYDPKSPKFGVGSRKDKPGLFIDWTVNDLGFSKGDRLLEVNGKVVLSMKNNHDLNRLLEVSPSSVRVVVMHDGPSAKHQMELVTLRRELDACRTRAEEMDRSKHAYKTENVRLSHRVSYLEDQVSELIKCRSSSTASNGVGGGSGVVFQRGANSAVMVRSKSPKHGVSAIQQYKRKQVVYDDRPAAVRAPEGGPVVKTRIRTVPRLYGSSASVESLVSSSDAVVAACKSFDDLHGVAEAHGKRNKYPAAGGRNSSRTRHIREAQQTLFRFLDSESSGGGGTAPYLLQQCGGGSLKSLDLQDTTAADSHRLKSTEYYSHLTAAGATSSSAAGSPRPSRSLNYDSEQSGRRAPMPPKKPLRLSLQQRQSNSSAAAGKNDAKNTATTVHDNGGDNDNNVVVRLRHNHQRRRRNEDDVDLSAINNTMS
ncbi:uncharacterized protein LOC100575278 [Acyrthosiphon pisum]|uniref:PDZ domain-containing protein n=1 Tax=Acyrthosiphon pisum TaxID=7029 RepID=A0A8R2A6M3_ACYPI|nr:uncharacterized protein LOC100575278 [Acyrthosiphon pisum]|eukprot:XP_003241879.1 PREDICTED: uncharacterized protein LOC100575278 [Acyrthosiphon pisum]